MGGGLCVSVGVGDGESADVGLDVGFSGVGVEICIEWK